jgi:hypothetical protein
MNGLIAFLIIIVLLLALFSTPFKLIDTEFSSFGFEWLENRDVWLFCFASWMSLALIFHVISRILKNKNASAEERFGNPFLTIGFLTLFLSFIMAMFIFYRFKNDFTLYYLFASTILVAIVYLIFKKSTQKMMLGAIAMGCIVVSLSAFYVFNYSDTFIIKGSNTNTQTIDETNTANNIEYQKQKSETFEPASMDEGKSEKEVDNAQQPETVVNDFPIELEEAKSIYSEFSEAIVNEDLGKLNLLMDENLDFWHSLTNITKQEVFEDMTNYQKKWHALSVEINNFISKGDNLFEYEILYQIERRNNATDIKKYEITGVIKLNNDKKIIGVKDIDTRKIND